MRKVAFIRIVAAVVVCAFLIAMVTFAADERARAKRHAKVIELEGTATTLRDQSMSKVIASLGQPTFLTVVTDELAPVHESSSPAPQSERVLLTYEFTFGSVPWRPASHASLIFEFKGPALRATRSGTSQDWR